MGYRPSVYLVLRIFDTKYRQPKFKLPAQKPYVELTFEHIVMEKIFNDHLHIFDHARLNKAMTLPTWPDIGRHPERKMSATKSLLNGERRQLQLPEHFRSLQT